MRNILWVSRHSMTEEQLSDLKRIYGEELSMQQYDATLHSAKELLPLLQDCDILAVVLPLDKLAELMPLAGGRPVIQSVSARKATGKKIRNAAGSEEAEYRFEHQYWQQVEKLEIRCKKL